MFFNGIGPSPPPIPQEFNLSTGCDTTVTIPTSNIEVVDITLCGQIYSIQDIFATQSDFIAFLNNTFLPAFGLLGSFYIDNNELIYLTTSTCTGTNCIELIIGGLLTDGGDQIKTDDGFSLEVD